jgi:RNA polymerase sigma-70 factor (sigma-E family)
VLSFEAFYGDEYISVVRALTLALGDQGRAEDAAQEAFVKAYRRWRRVAAMARPGAWVYVVAVNADRRRFRSGREEPTDDPVGDAVEWSTTWTEGASLRGALAALTPRQRAAVVLRYLADLTVDDVADALGCSSGTVKATLHVALRRLRVELADKDVVDAH